ncbi:MAG TPA: hypothetical protein VMV77_07640 [Bacteroidales bacterium]|nr:hypothetical protein [Bacteroidales bacterium]
MVTIESLGHSKASLVSSKASLVSTNESLGSSKASLVSANESFGHSNAYLDSSGGMGWKALYANVDLNLYEVVAGLRNVPDSTGLLT